MQKYIQLYNIYLTAKAKLQLLPQLNCKIHQDSLVITASPTDGYYIGNNYHIAFSE